MTSQVLSVGSQGSREWQQKTLHKEQEVRLLSHCPAISTTVYVYSMPFIGMQQR